jgi:putative methyltransferase (TIGR04325 family)
MSHLPGIRQMQQRAYLHRFAENTDENLFMGVFDSFADAAQHAPPTRPIGYDNPESAQLYGPKVCDYDYPAMFWLDRSLAEGMRSVFDLGGHVGIKYYAFRRPMAFPANLRWVVCDVPAVVARGREIAAARPPGERPSFTTNLLDASGFDVLYASGSLQYLPPHIDTLLSELKPPPRRLILNITAVHPTRTYITLNSIGTAFCPYRVQAYDELIEEVRRVGYIQRDAWENLGKRLVLPFAPNLSLDHYTGFCFDAGPGVRRS